MLSSQTPQLQRTVAGLHGCLTMLLARSSVQRAGTTGCAGSSSGAGTAGRAVLAASAQRRQVEVVTRVASHGVERAGTGGRSFSVAALPAFAALVMGLALIALPGVRRRLVTPRRPR